MLVQGSIMSVVGNTLTLGGVIVPATIEQPPGLVRATCAACSHYHETENQPGRYCDIRPISIFGCITSASLSCESFVDRSGRARCSHCVHTSITCPGCDITSFINFRPCGHCQQTVLVDVEEILICCNCHQEIDSGDETTIVNETWCDSCVSDNYGTCESCDDLVPQDDLCLVYSGYRRNETYVCESCRDDNYIRCDDCGDYFDSEGILLRDNSADYCESCSESRTVCESCGDIIWSDDSYWNEHDGCSYCAACYRDNNDNIIEDYSYKPAPIFYGGDSVKRPLYMGVELEIDGGGDCDEVAGDIANTADQVYMKNDGSLNDGFEIVSHPATLTYHTTELPWKHIMDIAKSGGFKSHNTSTCGLHVHVNRDFFGNTEQEQDLHIAKVLILTNNIWDDMVKLSRRDYSALESWAKKVDLDIQSYDTRTDIVAKAKASKNSGRYQAWNLQNRHTIECRVFRGTLNVDTFNATLQLVDTICRYAKRHSLEHIQTTTFNTFRKSCKQTELAAYITKKIG